ncbi:uncharacterized protein ColSpa_12822 [Colletotrichum spaethianum]|uniref:Uncharacterized protein n=1 Tax=Colletotrichum spaethianum TaxID=700344 RepID=A0AA37PHW5_9PEZI|nr:uncharacterized protein ColSpa_12822 [Colletotrichum spaethianum]GKT52641.1 hypothetical protein ColSpa_12822 [Colletotrichum spaethianum]
MLFLCATTGHLKSTFNSQDETSKKRKTKTKSKEDSLEAAPSAAVAPVMNCLARDYRMRGPTALDRLEDFTGTQ